MARLGYSEAQIAHVGRDAYNYQACGQTRALPFVTGMRCFLQGVSV
jgi:hypothetical protein